jgi:hypothetical protein
MMEQSKFFDYEALSKKFNVNSEVLAQFVKEATEEFPDDNMMIELHVIRALNWLNKKKSLN